MKTRILKSVAAVFFLLMASAFVHGKEDVPEPVRQGLVAYLEGTYTIAIDVWLKNSVLEDPVAVKKDLSSLGAVERLYGSYEGYEVVREVVLSSRAKRVYIAFYYERGPLWFYFDVYHKKDGTWVINGIKSDKNAEDLLPEGYLGHK